MAMNPTILAGLIQAALVGNPASGAVPGPALDALCSAIASAVVAHILSSGAVAVVTACPAGAGTGTGTIT